MLAEIIEIFHSMKELKEEEWNVTTTTIVNR